MASKTLALLGPLRVRVGGERVPLGGTRSECILAALLLDPGRTVSIDRLIAAGWGDHPPTSARAQVQNRVGTLRRALRAARPGGDIIVTEGTGYLVDLDGWELDLRRFDEEIRRAEVLSAARRVAEARAALGAALKLWRGPALDGLETPPLAAAAVRLEERRLTALERRIHLDLDLGRHRDLVPELTELAGAHPFREEVHALLMLALHRSGQRVAALNAYRRLRAMLGEQIGVEPGARIRTLHEALLRGESAPAVRDADPAVDRPGDPRGAPGRSPGPAVNSRRSPGRRCCWCRAGSPRSGRPTT
ncbi:AfsR/SARP family transcriptional regulator [Micromonospora siamensis]|uniref:DNA-binding transcriptional activator of the SARP family n=1 Tax=Micromonospora siamensis TaxID=299152 RepID=A0A1C5I9X7_9ACTN|nr:AfsR/SARP family transcriptional regulator [Micromonospora siamensis]SCG55067.1 DNA-binding transcriptional activator of the SARP family [Micromonospora siamensis]